MTLTDYQVRASRTAVYPHRGHNIEYTVLGLCGEVGEIANQVKKISRDDDDVITEKRRMALKKELDVLWYVAATALAELNLGLDGIAEMNLDKLASREDRGQLTGDGDNR